MTDYYQPPRKTGFNLDYNFFDGISVGNQSCEAVVGI